MKLRNEAIRLLTVYQEHKDSDDAMMRRRAHLALDRFLMENREEVTQAYIKTMSAKKRSWYRRLFNANRNDKVDRSTKATLKQ